MKGGDLAAWQRRNGLRTDASAAEVVGLSPGQYWRQRNGKSPVSRQTEMLTEYYELMHTLGPFGLASIADTLNKLIRMNITRR